MQVTGNMHSNRLNQILVIKAMQERALTSFVSGLVNMVVTMHTNVKYFFILIAVFPMNLFYYN